MASDHAGQRGGSGRYTVNPDIRRLYNVRMQWNVVLLYCTKCFNSLLSKPAIGNEVHHECPQVSMLTQPGSLLGPIAASGLMEVNFKISFV
jgi:hypothetical protein